MVSQSDMTDGGLESGAEEIDEQDPRARKNVVHRVYHASKELRNLLLDVKPVLSWPPKADELQSDAALVPDMLYNMLAWTLTSDTEFSTERVINLPNHVHRWILSLGKDLIHCDSRGRAKTAKHVLLPMTVKSFNGNAELVTLLHRFGHGLSYSQIEELETAIAEQQITRDEEDVQKVMEVISQWRNPFETTDDLVSLSSGSIASSALKEDLLKAEEKGKSALVSFVQDKLTSSAVRFLETLPRLKLRTFGEVKKTVNQGGKSFVLRTDRNLFARLLVLGQSRQIDLGDLLTHELGPVPWVSGNLRWLTGYDKQVRSSEASGGWCRDPTKSNKCFCCHRRCHGTTENST